jgi:hypothetical protein
LLLNVRPIEREFRQYDTIFRRYDTLNDMLYAAVALRTAFGAVPSTSYVVQSATFSTFDRGPKACNVSQFVIALIHHVLYISADSIANVKLLIVLGGRIKQAISHFHDVICPERLKAV